MWTESYVVCVEYNFSPSQISTFLDCDRKWALGSIAKIRMESGTAAALGTETHTQLETYLSGGQIDYTRDSGYIAASGLHHLPAPPLSKTLLESKFKFQSPATGFFYNGIRDVFIPGEVPLVIDHKTTSGLRWAKTVEDLLGDPQAMIYAYSAMAPVVNLRWVYYQTKGARKSKPVHLTVSRGHVEEQFDRIELTTREMRAILDLQTEDKKAYALSLEPSPESCEKFGGCQYRHLCNLGPQDRITSFFKQAQQQEQIMSVQSLVERLKAATSQGAKVEVIDEGKPSQSVTTFSKDFINPPPIDAPAFEAPAPQSVVDVIAAATPEDVKKAVAKAKRDAKKEAAKKVVEEVIQATDMVFEEVVGPGLPSEPQMPVEQKKGYDLYIDCLPDGHIQDMAYIFGIAKKAVAEKAGVPDYRLVQFGAGPGYLEVAVQDLINNGMLSGKVYVSTQCQETHACLSLLVSRAESVIRSTR